MDQLWRELKRLIAAHRQAISANALASDAADWVLGLTPQQGRRKTGMASQHYWLRKLVRDFWPPTLGIIETFDEYECLSMTQNTISMGAVAKAVGNREQRLRRD